MHAINRLGIVFLTCCVLGKSAIGASEGTDELAGTASLSGTIVTEQTVVAAKVYAHNAERRVTYMVYTHKHRYRAVHMFPGSYEVRVEYPGFSSRPRTVEVLAGKNTEADLTISVTSGQVITVAGRDPALLEVEAAPYEEIYPPGPGRETLERECIRCHGVHYMPGRPMSGPAWNAMLDLMLGDAPAYGVPNGAPLMEAGTISEQQRAELLDYLTRNFGPDQSPRSVLMDAPLALDEPALSTAMWVEYSVAQPKAANGTDRWIQEPYFDLQGNVWLTERTAGAAAILRLDPRTGEFKKYPTPDPNSSPHGLVVDPIDAEASVWWAGRSVHLARLNPKTGETRSYPAPPGKHGHTPVFDSKGDLWFSMLTGNAIGKWDRDSDTIKTWQIPTPGGRPYGILVDRMDKVWFAEFHSCKIARFDPIAEKFDEYRVPSSPCTIRRLGLDSEGKIWYGAYSKGMLGVLDPATGAVKEYTLGKFSEPYDAWADPDDNIWVSDGGQGGLLVKFDQKTERLTNYPSPLRSDMPKIAITRDGAIWYSNRWIARSGAAPATVGVLYPNVRRMKAYGAYYALQDGRAVGSGSPRPER